MFNVNASLHCSVIQRADPLFLQGTIAAVLQIHLWKPPNCLPPHLSLSQAIMHHSRWVYLALFFNTLWMYCGISLTFSLLGWRILWWIWRIQCRALIGWFCSGFCKPSELISRVLRVRNRLYYRYAEQLCHYRGDSTGAGRAHLRTGVLLMTFW